MSDSTLEKVLKRISSPDDNNKVATLALIPKLWPDAAAFTKSPQAGLIWEALSSTQFLPRALKDDGFRSLVFETLTAFSFHLSQEDLSFYIQLLIGHLPDSLDCLCTLCSLCDDCSVIFIPHKPSAWDLTQLLSILYSSKNLGFRAEVINFREFIFKQLTGTEPLPLRAQIFRVIGVMTEKTEYKFAVLKGLSSMDIQPFLMAIRLAAIELRLQLEFPKDFVNPPNIKTPFSQDLGDLKNAEYAAAALGLLNVAVAPLIAFESLLSDEEAMLFINQLESVVIEWASLIPMIDSQQPESKGLLSVLARWLCEAPFLCHCPQLNAILPQLYSLVNSFDDLKELFVGVWEICKEEGVFKCK